MTKALKKRYLFSWNFDKFICVFLFVFCYLLSLCLPMENKKKYQRYDVDHFFNEKMLAFFAQICGQIEFTAEIVSEHE